jgi:hypothetical protein
VFASRQVLTDFLTASFLLLAVPLMLVVGTRYYLEGRTDLTETMKTAYTVGPSVVFMNIVMGYYIYRVVKDP